MAEITLTPEIRVEEVLHCGDDATVVAAARVSTRGWSSLPGEEAAGLIRSLLRNRPAHTVPLEHSLLTVRAHAPAFVWWEWTRHRFQAVDVPGLSFSLQSGRYGPLKPVFWIPHPERAMVGVSGFKAMRPEFRRVSAAEHTVHCRTLASGYEAAWAAYQAILDNGIASEIARAVLGFGVYYAGWASGSLLAWLHFLARRTRQEGTEAAGYPQAEIEDAARQVETLVATHWPVTYACWIANGRAAP